MKIIKYVSYTELDNFRNNEMTLNQLLVSSSRDKTDKQFPETIEIIIPDKEIKETK